MSCQSVIEDVVLVISPILRKVVQVVTFQTCILVIEGLCLCVLRFLGFLQSLQANSEVLTLN